MSSQLVPGAERRRPENAAQRASAIIVTDAWISRCAQRVCSRDPAIDHGDADELAWFMYCQDRYRKLPPEHAVDTLFSDQHRWIA